MLFIQIIVVALFGFAGVVMARLMSNAAGAVRVNTSPSPAPETIAVEHHIHHYNTVATGEQVERQLPDGTVVRTQKVTRWN
jgi:hypothetical protein